CFQGSHVPPTF
nr:immunoglobulin light chain junction region [Mus musculus]NSL97109.1 immunoglobulin light chain junction region [Mus musculus]NSL97145.1 immunoglobulin light chain junction region [Mus musculus]NSL97182.1 immunoglobulin light chain junction region [Mus musculus]NSL97300.1 immunoglobulin light chain junction region [Mus musculus]